MHWVVKRWSSYLHVDSFPRWGTSLGAASVFHTRAAAVSVRDAERQSVKGTTAARVPIVLVKVHTSVDLRREREALRQVRDAAVRLCTSELDQEANRRALFEVLYRAGMLASPTPPPSKPVGPPPAREPPFPIPRHMKPKGKRKRACHRAGAGLPGTSATTTTQEE